MNAFTTWTTTHTDAVVFIGLVFSAFCGYAIGRMERKQYQRELLAAYRETESLRDMLHAQVRNQQTTVSYRLMSSTHPSVTGGN